MSKIKKNHVVKGLQGMFGDSLVFKTVRGKTIAAAPPTKGDRATTPKQLEHKKRFKKGVIYGKAMFAIPAERAEYEGGDPKNKKNAYQVALSDYMKPPVVDQIKVKNFTGKKGDTISIEATDDFKVKSVKLQIYASDGKLLEEGQAVLQPDNIEWLYTSTTAIATISGLKLVATALDKPKNEGTLEVILP